MKNPKGSPLASLLTAQGRFFPLLAGVFLMAFSKPVFSAGIPPPSPTDEGRALLKSRAYHLAMERFLLVQEKSESYIEKAMALRLIGETQFHEKDYAAAYQAYQQSLRLNPLTSGALGLEFKSAVALVYLKNYPSAIDKFRELEKRAYEKDTLCDLYFWQAECHFQLEQYGEAGKEYEKILETKPDYRFGDMVRYLQAWCYFQKRDYPKALESFSGVLGRSKDETLKKLALFQVAETQFRIERYAEAKGNYQSFLKQYPKDFLEVPALYGLGWTFEKLKDPSEAVDTFGLIVTNFPSHLLAPWAAVRRGAEAYQEGNHDQSRQAYTQGLELAAGKAPADLLEYGLGWLDYSDGKYDAASRHFLNVSNFLPASDLYGDAQYLLAGCEYLEGKYDDAKAIYGRLAVKSPSELAQAAAYVAGLVRLRPGQRRLRLPWRSSKKWMRNPRVTWKARAAWACAESAYEMKNYADAAGFYQRALDTGPSDRLSLNCYSGLGWSLFQQEKYEDAARAFQSAVRLDPSAPLGLEAQLRTGDCYYNLHNYPKAESAYRPLVEGRAGPPYELDAQEQMGWCGYRQEKFNDAIATWGSLLKKDGTDDRKSRILYWTAWAYFRRLRGFPDDAAGEFKKWKRIIPRNAPGPRVPLCGSPTAFSTSNGSRIRRRPTKASWTSSCLSRTIRCFPTPFTDSNGPPKNWAKKDTSSNVAKQFRKVPLQSLRLQHPVPDGRGLNSTDEKFDEAIQAYKDLLAKYPDSAEAPRAIFWLGTALVKKEKNDDAIPVFQETPEEIPQRSAGPGGRVQPGFGLFRDRQVPGCPERA